MTASDSSTSQPARRPLPGSGPWVDSSTERRDPPPVRERLSGWAWNLVWFSGLAVAAVGSVDLVDEWSANLALLQFLILAITGGVALLQSNPDLASADLSRTTTAKDPLPATTGIRAKRLWIEAAVVAGLVVVAAALPCWFMASRPPILSYHDEYSYRFQAACLLHGGFTTPAARGAPQLFDQMHVLRQGEHLGSRYYPGQGFWLAPWLACGHAEWAGPFAAMLSVLVIWRIGRRWHRGSTCETARSNRWCGWLAAGGLAIAPGAVYFHATELAHSATLLGLVVGLWQAIDAADRVRAQRAWGWSAAAAGAGFVFAGLCRPATAIGFGLPIVTLVAWRIVQAARSRPKPDSANQDSRSVIAPSTTTDTRSLWFRLSGGCVGAAIPVVAGAGIALSYNAAVTGDWRVSAYQLYTDRHTPAHAYGFNNVERARGRQGPDVLQAYDSWAENLTPEVALRNASIRWFVLWMWNSDPVVMTLLFVVLVLRAGSLSDREQFAVAGILGLHAIHVPYWYVGILGSHYVFESMVGWTLLLAGVVSRIRLDRGSRPATGTTGAAADESSLLVVSPWLARGLGGVLVLGMLALWLPVPGVWVSRGERLRQDTVFSRNKMAAVDQLIAERVLDRPAIVLIDETDDSFQLSYIVNWPPLAGQPVLRGRWPTEPTAMANLQAAYPERTIYRVHPERGTCARIAGPKQ